MASPCALLLDLHNLYANASNFGFDTTAYLARLPMERIAAIHLAGGKWSTGQRLLDDHLHDVPDPVYTLLTEVGARAPQGLTVILERDGQYPPMAHLLAQLERARAALALGRQRRLHTPPPSTPSGASRRECGLDGGLSAAFEIFLARLYVEAPVRARFLVDPQAEAIKAGLTPSEVQTLQHIDRDGLILAASSFAHKRQQMQRARTRFTFPWSL